MSRRRTRRTLVGIILAGIFYVTLNEQFGSVEQFNGVQSAFASDGRSAPYDHGVVCYAYFIYNYFLTPPGIQERRDCFIDGQQSTPLQENPQIPGQTELAKQGILQTGGSGSVCLLPHHGAHCLGPGIDGTPVPIAARTLVELTPHSTGALEVTTLVSGATTGASEICLSVPEYIPGIERIVPENCVSGTVTNTTISLTVELVDTAPRWISVGIRSETILSAANPAALAVHSISYTIR